MDGGPVERWLVRAHPAHRQGSKDQAESREGSMGAVTVTASTWESIAVGDDAPVPAVVEWWLKDWCVGKGMWKWRVLVVTLRDRRTEYGVHQHYMLGLFWHP